jgi:hypothetical protein
VALAAASGAATGAGVSAIAGRAGFGFDGLAGRGANSDAACAAAGTGLALIAARPSSASSRRRERKIIGIAVVKEAIAETSIVCAAQRRLP